MVNEQQRIAQIKEETSKAVRDGKYFSSETLLDYLTFIENNSGLLSTEEMAQVKGNLFSLLAIDRKNKGLDDRLFQTWINMALHHDPSHKLALQLKSENNYREKKNLFEELQFPSIRETDNRPAKKKIAEEYIEICKKYLDIIDDEWDDVEKAYGLTKNDPDAVLLSLYERMLLLLQEFQSHFSHLLKASEEYKESITGVFYTSVHFENVKNHLQRIKDLKKEWENLFEDEEPLSEDHKNPLEELNNMIGLHQIKNRINSYYQFLQYQKKREKLGFQVKKDHSLNMVFTGNPGTGKTTLARLFAKIYHQLGLLEREEVLEVDRSQLVGAYMGQTEENIKMIIEKALGGVLFIDEAYSLKREGQSGNDFGQTAIDTLVSLMTHKDYKGKFSVILAGYPEEMRQFLRSNPGLRSRFPESNHFHLPDYSMDELLMIGEKMANERDYYLTASAKRELKNRLEKEKVDETFGNARAVESIILNAIFKKGASTTFENEDNVTNFTVLDGEDFTLDIDHDDSRPIEKLNELVGLDDIKKEVEGLISFVKMQKIRKENGLPTVPIQLHSVFTGNPGTGKTTVAKIYSELLKECGVLKRGHLIIASRADFVAGYVGQTAIKTKKKIRDALGGVLFIDEAYSLFSSTSNDFGKEVIDTLVDEMTKHNENLVVVLAGYHNEINVLLESNPGLRSRFKKFFHFPDYSVDEMIEIMKKYSNRYQYRLSEESISYIKDRLESLPLKGNGRLATNIVDEAIQAQAYRILKNSTLLSVEEAQSILIDDVKVALNKIQKGEKIDVY
ncbi:AAA family ATPase [Peribacillus tepidiphilus]|uniref:AAA family ATPase n=1 Tax=Peribacillus tepidiphilus TaxID=2652445 RepID=UPI0035B5312D